MTDLKRIALFLQLLSMPITLTAQHEVILSDHKPLLGEVHYGNRVGGIQAQEGKTLQTPRFPENAILKSIQVFLSDRQIVAGFTLEFYTGSLNEYISFGNVQASPQEKYHVPKGRNLIGIKGASGWYIDSLAFVLDDGSTTPRYGGRGGDLNFSLVLNRKPNGALLGRLMGFWGSSTKELETIGLVFWPLE